MGEEVISLHVRRGDSNLVDPRGFKWSYTQCGDQHPVQPLEYYEKAITQILQKSTLANTDFQNWDEDTRLTFCLLYTSPSPRDRQKSRMPSSA